MKLFKRIVTMFGPSLYIVAGILSAHDQFLGGLLVIFVAAGVMAVRDADRYEQAYQDALDDQAQDKQDLTQQVGQS